MIYSKSKEERSKSSEQHDLGRPLLKLSKSKRESVMLMESKPWTIYWSSQGQKKEHLNRMREIQLRETSADTERVKYNSEGIKIGSSKNIDLLKVKRTQWSCKIQQHFCWSPVNHHYTCTKRKIIASKHEKQNQTSRNIGQHVYYNYLLTRLRRHKIWN